MYFYVDESGHTGNELFDPAQPTLYYGVLSSDINLDLVAEPRLRALRRQLHVPRLHAAELGMGRLAQIADALVSMQKQFNLRFDLYRVQKPDHAIISFFDQVFDQGINPAVPWTGYWTPMRYAYLLHLASAFDEVTAKLAWAARIETRADKANAMLVDVCNTLLERVEGFSDGRARQVIGDALRWTALNPVAIGYHATDKDQIKQISPNIIGFQSVMHGIAARLRQRAKRASRIVVDRQTQFNQAQKTLADFYAAASGVRSSMGPGMPVINFSSMPKTSIEFVAGDSSAGLELVDVYVWLFKRGFEGKTLAPEFAPLINGQLTKGKTDEMSLDALDKRWSRWFDQIPELEDMSAEQQANAVEIINRQETARLAAMGDFKRLNN